MDISKFRNRVHEFKNLFATISKFKNNRAHSKENSEVLILAKGIALLFLAITLAWMSKNETENNTRDRVLQTEWPTIQVWKATLAQGGWSRMIKTDFSALLKNHPDPFSSQPMIWESDDHCFIFLTKSPYPSENPEPDLWHCASSQKKSSKLKWHKIGAGYAGINHLAEIEVPKLKKTVSYVDPKEIRY